VPGDGFASARSLARLVASSRVACAPAGFDRYDRILARCAAAGRDLSCAQVAAGQAVRRYGRLKCP